MQVDAQFATDMLKTVVRATKDLFSLDTRALLNVQVVIGWTAKSVVSVIRRVKRAMAART